ncbi:hypothetical protein SDC9_74927 [bioreactor metagenome]|uniref:Uncharacterized protein n=1 Tax=bioreactor metagenome TaxID=1076179 RepID=A0A644YIJ4_9ZZZZ
MKLQGRIKRWVAPEIIALAGRLDLDDLGAHVGQKHGGIRACNVVGEVQNPYALQRQRRTVGARRVRGQTGLNG